MAEVLPSRTFFIWFHERMHPQLTPGIVDFHSMHPKCVWVVGTFLWSQFAQKVKPSPFYIQSHFQWADYSPFLMSLCLRVMPRFRLLMNIR